MALSARRGCGESSPSPSPRRTRPSQHEAFAQQPSARFSPRLSPRRPEPLRAHVSVVTPRRDEGTAAPPPPPPPPQLLAIPLRPQPPPSRERPRGAAARPTSYALRLKLPPLPLGKARVSCASDDGDSGSSECVRAVTVDDVTRQSHVSPLPRQGSVAGPRASSAQEEQERRWNIVRAVVLDTPRAKSIAASVARRGSAAGTKGGTARPTTPLVSDYGSGTPLRSVLLKFHAAKMAYIRKRLGGEWFIYDQEQKRHVFMLDPRKRVRRTWDFTVMFFVLYTACAVPYDTAFSPPIGALRSHFELAVTIVFAVDIVLNFFTGRVDKTGKLLSDPRYIAKRYLRRWFGLDVLATLPLDIMFGNIGGGSAGDRLRLLAFLKTPRLLRLSRVLRLMDNMRGAVYIRILRLVVVLCLLTHWLACGLYLLAVLNAHVPNWLDAALEDAELLGAPESSLYDCYTMAFNNAILVLVGNGFRTSSASERVFCAMATLLGAFVQAAIFGNAAQVIAAMGATASRHQARADATMETARYLGIPPELQTRMADYFSFMSGCSHPGEEGMSRLAELSPPLYRDIMVHLYGDVIRGVPLFHGLPAGLIAACAARVRPRIFMAGEAVFAAGELSREMYFLVHGTVEVSNAAGRRLTLLEDGAFFGELALLANVQRSASVTTLTVCDICVFTSANLAAVLDDFPDAEPRMRARALRRMAQLQRESEAAEAGGAGVRRRSVAAATADLDHDSTLLGLAPLLSGELSARRSAKNGTAVPPAAQTLASQASLALRPRRRGSLLAEAVAAASPRRAHSTAVDGSEAQQPPPSAWTGNLSPRRDLSAHV